MGSFSGPMVPVPVHQVLGDIGLRLVKGRVVIRRDGDGAVDCADVHEGCSVGTKREFGNAGRDIAYLHALGKLAGRICSLVNLPSLYVKYALSVVCPTGAGNAFPAAGQLLAAASVHIADENVAAAAVLFYRGVTHSEQYGLPVRRKLGVGQPSKGKQHLGSHLPVHGYNGGRAYITPSRFCLATICHQ